MKKCINTSENIQQALLHVRATPIDAKLPSPAELLTKRQITTSLASHPNNMSDETIKNRLEERSASMKKYYDRNARKKTYHHYIQDRMSGSWINHPRHGAEVLWFKNAYIISTAGGTKVRRNRRHLREMISQTADINPNSMQHVTSTYTTAPTLNPEESEGGLEAKKAGLRCPKCKRCASKLVPLSLGTGESRVNCQRCKKYAMKFVPLTLVELLRYL